MGIALASVAIGLDIQVSSDKILHTAHKFCSTNDKKVLKGHVPAQQVAGTVWSAKEAAYKAYGKKGLQFNRDISILCADRCSAYLRLDMMISGHGAKTNYAVYIRRIAQLTVATALLEPGQK